MLRKLVSVVSCSRIDEASSPWPVYDVIPLDLNSPHRLYCTILVAPLDVLSSRAFSLYPDSGVMSTSFVSQVEV